MNKNQLYGELVPLMTRKRALPLDDPTLKRQLLALERRRGTAGRDRVDLRPGAHDDVANGAAGGLMLE
jgi:hypothetical protein